VSSSPTRTIRRRRGCKYEHPDTGEVRVVSVPLKDSDRISQDTYRSIADQCGADDFDATVVERGHADESERV